VTDLDRLATLRSAGLVVSDEQGVVPEDAFGCVEEVDLTTCLGDRRGAPELGGVGMPEDADLEVGVPIGLSRWRAVLLQSDSLRGSAPPGK